MAHNRINWTASGNCGFWPARKQVFFPRRLPLGRASRALAVGLLLALALGQTGACALAGDSLSDFSTYEFAADILFDDGWEKDVIARFPVAGEVGASGANIPVRVKIGACEVPGCQAEHRKAGRWAVDKWNGFSLFGEYKLEVTSQDPHIIIEWIEDFRDEDVPGASGGQTNNYIGLCTANFHRGSGERKVLFDYPETIQMATRYGPDGGLSDIPLDRIRWVAAHELGHCLGLWQHSPREGDLMYFAITAETSLTLRDINTLRLLYQTEPVAWPQRATTTTSNRVSGQAGAGKFFPHFQAPVIWQRPGSP